jgi:hypothetical protein
MVTVELFGRTRAVGEWGQFVWLGPRRGEGRSSSATPHSSPLSTSQPRAPQPLLMRGTAPSYVVVLTRPRVDEKRQDCRWVQNRPGPSGGRRRPRRARAAATGGETQQADQTNKDATETHHQTPVTTSAEAFDQAQTNLLACTTEARAWSVSEYYTREWRPPPVRHPTYRNRRESCRRA